NNLDIVIVFDRSGSMEFDTLCYGCWQAQSGVPYPGGLIYPLPWNGPPNGPPAHCGPTQEFTYSGYRYYYIEAEEYSRASNPYNRYLYVPYYTYWVMQREPGDGASGRDSRGAYIMHMPYSDHETPVTNSPGYGVTCRYEAVNNDGQCAASGYTRCYCKMDVSGGPFPAPRVDYDFTVLTAGNYYIWVRGQAPYNWRLCSDANASCIDRRIFWNVDNSAISIEADFTRGTGYNGASSGSWQWRRLNDTPFSWAAGSQHTLRIWAGGAGFALDRIVITTNPNGTDGSPPSDVTRTGIWSNGRTDWACSPCDARFGGYPGGCGQSTCAYSPNCNSGPNPDRRRDDIYDDEQPIRAAIEAAKRFVGMLDYRYDQIGYVSYASDVTVNSELQCLRRLGAQNCTPSVITSTVVAQLDATTAGGGTNIGGGIQKGIEVLSTQAGHYGRPGAAHIMILMTDGRPNVVPNSTCYTYNLIQKYGLTPPTNPNERQGMECTLYYAEQARNNSIVIYTITLGDSADFELMETVANITGGVHRNADRPEKLNQIFDELYERIFLRLVE
ncbi:MAG: VWA domain-containing protein, partial [Thermoflexia bacterium]